MHRYVLIKMEKRVTSYKRGKRENNSFEFSRKNKKIYEVGVQRLNILRESFFYLWMTANV